ncbi:DUF742 domain-containing protein [Streptomyces sp. 4N509B]|uniref:DUF742 domain-containing protein n=1 Tax=Streptomyces sp. 4N509B TaxID=3457413 RepID=UPI003FD5EB09
MRDRGGEPWLDEAAGQLIRPYAVSDGRTRPSTPFDLMDLVVATGRAGDTTLGLSHAQVLDLCRRPVTVAEIAAHTRLPAAVVKVLLSDLVELDAVTTRAFVPAPQQHDMIDIGLLKAVLDGLRKRL